MIEITHVSRRFGSRLALDNVCMSVPRGGVFGLIGGNGAGKTTLIKHVLGMLQAQSGSVRVFGMDPITQPVGVLGRMGYLSEERDLPNWMRVRELIRYTQAFYPTWDERFAKELREMFELDPNAKIRGLSRGQRARAGLLVALAHRPELLVLDEPSSGLDPVVRRDILSAIIRTIAHEGRTVLFSSHLLDEVERVADNVAMIHNGRVVLSDSLESLKDSYRRVTLRFETPIAEPPQLLGRMHTEGTGMEWTYVCNVSGRDASQIRGAAISLGAEVVDESSMSLDEIFVATACR
jgi:ABC-2 type transport system ATP-binding protein